jgi:hypothetical protein
MKLFTAIFFTASFISLRALVAQDAGTVPVPDNTPAPSTEPAPPPLFPGDNPPPIVNRPPRGSGGADSGAAAVNPPVSTSKTAVSAVSISDNIAYRKAKTQALRDDKVQQALADVDAAKNVPDKLAALKRYYTLLAEKILKIDGGIKKLVAARLKQSLLELNQSKVRPGESPQQQASAGH